MRIYKGDYFVSLPHYSSSKIEIIVITILQYLLDIK